MDLRYGYLDKVVGLEKVDAKGAKVEAQYQYLPSGMMAGKIRRISPAATFVANTEGSVSDVPISSMPTGTTSSERYVWDGIALLGHETAMNGRLDRKVFSAEPHLSGGSPLAVHSSKGDTLMVSDHLASTLAEIDHAEGMMRQANMTGFGSGGASENNGAVSVAANASIPHDVGGDTSRYFTGKPWDSDMGAYVFPFRNYSPEMGRWASADPKGFPDGLNNYAYCMNSSTSLLDPLGDTAHATYDSATRTDTITMSIAIYGTGLSQAISAYATLWQQGIHSAWSTTGIDKVDGGSLTINMAITITAFAVEFPSQIQGQFDNIIAVQTGNGVSFVLNGNGGTWFENLTARGVAHEAGHLMGLPDQYTESFPNGVRVTTPIPGHEAEIMANSSVGPIKKEYNQALKNLGITDHLLE